MSVSFAGQGMSITGQGKSPEAGFTQSDAKREERPMQVGMAKRSTSVGLNDDDGVAEEVSEARGMRRP